MLTNCAKSKVGRRFLCLFILIASATVFADEDYSQWQYSKTLTLNTTVSGANVAETVVNFPVLIRLNNANFSFYQAQADGRDLRFSKSDGSPISYEIERWDGVGQQAEVWVLVDSIKGNDNTQSIKMYWGKSGAISRSNGSAVFQTSNSFSAVYHLKEEQAGTGNPGIYKDATAHHYNGTDNIGTTGQEGVVGNGHQFGSTDNIYLGKFDPSPVKLTLSAWVKWNGPNGQHQVIFAKRSRWSTSSMRWQLHYAADRKYLLFYTAGCEANFQTMIPQGQWCHVVLTSTNGGTAKLYINGAQTGGDKIMRWDNRIDADVRIGRTDVSAESWNGFIDEAVIAGAIRSPAWIKLCYENQRIDQKLVVEKPSIVEDYSLWPYSQRIYFNTTPSGANVASDVQYFPFLVRLNVGNFDFYKAAYDGSDIRFSDPDGTPLPYEIESWNIVNREASIWVKIPKIDGNSNSDFILMHFGRVGVPDIQNSAGVWDSTFGGVWHMAQVPPAGIIDATGDGNNGTSYGAMTAASQVEGVISKGISFDGNDDFFDIGKKSGLKINGEITISAWVKASNIRACGGIGGKHSDRKGYGIVKNNSGYGFLVGNGYGDEIVSSNNAYADADWHYVVGVRSGSTNYLFIDGVKQSRIGHNAILDIDANAFIGKLDYNGCPGFCEGGFGKFVFWGWKKYVSHSIWNGIIDEFRISNRGRSVDWVKLCYENQRPDSKLQVTTSTTVSMAFDGSISNKKPGFNNKDTTIKTIHTGDNPKTSTLSHVLLRFDTRQAAMLQQMGWTLENAALNLTVDNLSSPLYRDSAFVGVYNPSRLFTIDRHDGYRVWREDVSTRDSVITMNVTKYIQGISGQPDSSGDWAWLLYDFKEGIRRLGFVEVDSITWFAGTQDNGGGVETFVKTSTLNEVPSENLWKNGGVGVTTRQHTFMGQKNKKGRIVCGINSFRWLWIATKRPGVDTTACAVWGDFKIYGKKHKEAEMLIYQIKDDGIDTNYLSWSYRGNGLPWRHDAFEQDAGTDSAEGIGTEDFVQIFPDHSPLWNRYKGKYRSRSPLASVKIFKGAEGVVATGLLIRNNMLSQAIQKAISDTGCHSITFLGVCKDSGTTISLVSSRSPKKVSHPRLDVNFSDSKILLSWEGRNSNLSVPEGRAITLSGNPPIGNGRYGRVVRFHVPGQYAHIVDTGLIDYSQGSISFWYQMTGGVSSDSGAGAVFFKRSITDNTQFRLQRDGNSGRISFYYGDTTADSTGTNRMTWAFIDSADTIVNPFDGNQHLLVLTWDCAASNVSLSIDGRYLIAKRYLNFTSNPALWLKANLVFGQNIDGYLENLIIRSRTKTPVPIPIVRTAIDKNGGYLPYIQPAFNDTVDCIVISPDDPLFREECDKYALRNISIGIRTTVVTLAQINKFYSGSDIQERIRNFLKQAYLSWHSKWLVLAGSVDLIPPRKVAFRSHGGNEVTTDRYYACLEGSWNDDGDQYFGETEDNTDMNAELIVGRLPANMWSDLRSMFERSAMGIGLPPYREQCLGNSDTVAISGIQMFGNMGAISDGQYYGNMLKDILQKGAYTSGLNIKTYYPNDDPTNNDSQTVEFRFNKFLDFLTPLPGMWVNFGHGNYANYQVDWIFGQFSQRVMLNINHLNQLRGFNLFRQMPHFRLVGCEANSINLCSFGNALTNKRYGGPLSVIAVSEYSYPIVESRLLQEEFRNIADSSIFTWGEVFRKSGNEILSGSGSWVIAQWVVFSRNFLGDPLMPVRYKKLQAKDSLTIKITGAIKRGENTIEVKITDATGGPVEGASIGLMSREIIGETSDTVILIGKTIKDIAFSHGITNRQGKVVLKIAVKDEDNLTVTAMHNDYVPSRKNIAVLNDVSGVYAFISRIWDENSDPSMHYNGIFEASDKISYMYYLHSDTLLDSGWADLVFDTAGTGIKVDSSTIGFVGRYYSPYYSLATGSFLLKEVPQGVTFLKARIRVYKSSSETTPYGEFTISIPVTGVKIVPVITYLFNQGDSTVFPSAGANVNMQILIGNKYSAKAQKVRCEVIDYNSSFCTISPAITDTHTIDPWSAEKDSAIMIQIASTYDEAVNGIITAKLRITGSNVKTDTLNIDLNPLRNVAIKMASPRGIELDYSQGVRLQWEPLRFDGNNRRSDFRGYVLLRYAEGDSAEALLTSSPVTSTCYYYDRMPDSGPSSYTYRIIAVDSSYNFSAETLLTITRPPFVKKGFPIFTGKDMSAPHIANFDKDTKAEIYSSDVGYRVDGQEAYIKGPNDGIVIDRTSTLISPDLNSDGFDDAICTTDSSLVAFNLKNGSKLWETIVKDGPYNEPTPGGALMWGMRMIADMNGDGQPEIIAYSYDNGGRATTLDIYSHDSIRLARKTFIGWGASPAMAVGDFKKGNGDSLEILIVSRGNPKAPPDSQEWTKYYLYFLDSYNVSDTSFHVSDSIKVSTIVDASDWVANVNSGLSVGRLTGSGDTLQVVLKTGPWSNSKAKDTLFVYSIDRNSGQFIRNGIDPVRAFYPVSFSENHLLGSSAALGDINKDGKEEIVFAGDDTIYVLKMVTLNSLALVQAIPFGNVPTHRLETSGGHTAQALLVNFDNDSNPQIIANHQGDGAIWAFKQNGAGIYRVKEGFPFKVKGRAFEACNITDMDGDGILDLTAVDQAGYLFAWNLDSGSINKQMWPAPFGNNWNTGHRGYHEAGVVGFLHEDWRANRAAPYAWIESGAGNATDTVTTEKVFIRNKGIMQTNASGDRNLHFTGLGVKNWKNYTVSGKIKFDNANAEFGINVYSQFTESAKKYTVMRRPDGKIQWWLYTGPATRTSIKVSDSVVAPNINTWYNYKITIINLMYNRMKVEFWPEGESDPTIDPEYKWDLNESDGTTPNTQLKVGRVGLVTSSGSGARYWGPITVVSNDLPAGANMAYEDFKSDTIVDIKPYTPVNWLPEYKPLTLPIGNDTTGFVFYKSATDTALIYRHKPGVQYPVSCRIVPPTNLEWKDYIFTGSIVKPVGSMYDSVDVSVEFYRTDGDHLYRLTFEKDGVYLIGGGLWCDTLYPTRFFNGGDSLSFTVTVVSNTINEVADSSISIIIQANKNGGSIVQLLKGSDESSARLKKGEAGINVDMSVVQDRPNLQPIRISRASIAKVQ